MVVNGWISCYAATYNFFFLDPLTIEWGKRRNVEVLSFGFFFSPQLSVLLVKLDLLLIEAVGSPSLAKLIFLSVCFTAAADNFPFQQEELALCRVFFYSYFYSSCNDKRIKMKEKWSFQSWQQKDLRKKKTRGKSHTKIAVEKFSRLYAHPRTFLSDWKSRMGFPLFFYSLKFFFSGYTEKRSRSLFK